MKFKVGDEITIKFERHEAKLNGIIKSFDENEVVFEIKEKLSYSPGDSIAIINSNDEEFYADLLKIENNLVSAKWAWEKSRRFFRVDDVIQVTCKKIDSQTPYRSRIFYGAGPLPAINFDEEDNDINPNLLKFLRSIDDKLTMILTRLEMDREKFFEGEFKKVNISASGIRFTTEELCQKDDIVEIKMLLPAIPVVGIVVYGKVIKVKELEGKREIAVDFLDIDESISEEIVRYTLNRQREMIRKQKIKNYE